MENMHRNQSRLRTVNNFYVNNSKPKRGAEYKQFSPFGSFHLLYHAKHIMTNEETALVT